MARGLEGIREIAENYKTRGDDFKRRSFLKLQPGETAVVRFLEEGEDVQYTKTHRVQRPGRQWAEHVPCLNADGAGTYCPACDKGIPQSFRGYINLIWRDAPVFKTDSQGKRVKENEQYVQVDTSDQVVIWEQGINVFSELDEKDLTYKGLCSRDFRVKRKGKSLDTTYSVEPADPDGGKQALSAADKKLVEDKFDLNEIVMAPSENEWLTILGQVSSSENGEASPNKRANPFINN